ERAYRGDRPPIDLHQRTVILIDDGAATGASMLAAVRAARKLGARKVVVGLPVSSREAYRNLRKEADDVVCVNLPPSFAAVGYWYEDFGQTADEEVTSLLERAAKAPQADSG
ncbi:MAG TPA: phosphoribosyltransferase family protein, partial [Steroidobacter sp.]|nr:phosphoribosyltransferase family protein [Steroidobacter sp.]